jgi:CheY-like chemotaxis protein
MALAPMDNKLNLYFNPKSNVYGDVNTVIVVDDDEAINRMLCLAITDAHPQIIAVGCIKPERCLPLFLHLYFDILISDINMPGLMGDKVIEALRNYSPTTFTMAMTGYSMDSAFIAGKAHPDFFLDKNKGFSILVSEIGKGIQAALMRQKLVLNSLEKEASLPPQEKDYRFRHWRKRRLMKQFLGFSPNTMAQSRGLLKALTLLSGRKKLTKETIAYCSGFSSYQRMRRHLKKIAPFFNIPSF